ncbi:MAG: rane protein [Hyphomicrobiales bacterium]|nr:rane protein [Hyphomicrobiales bacterium]
MNRVLTRNIEVLRDERARMMSESPLSDRIADVITRFTGSMTFVVVHLAIVAGWVLANTGALPVAAFDPTFVILATAASVEAIFLSTFVLISQNRASELANRRADLDVQINLLAEHEVTKLVELVTRIAEHIGVPVDQGEMSELKKDVAPEAVLERISQEGAPKKDKR